jgi:O-methyltransferase
MPSLRKKLKGLVNLPLKRFGFELVRFTPSGEVFTAMEASSVDLKIYQTVSPFTMADPDPILSLIQSVRYVVENEIEGDFVECGTWRGGCAMAIALTLLDLGVTDRVIWVYDTFAGMTEPSAVDVTNDKYRTSAEALLQKYNSQTTESDWEKVSMEGVKRRLITTGYPIQNFRLVKGSVLDTLDLEVPEVVCLLRLDTDWYDSTRKELEVIYPKLSEGGVCIVDDYGAWAGSKQAVDEYFASHIPRPLFHVTNWAVRTWIKTSSSE